jgi:hypothetical protein
MWTLRNTAEIPATTMGSDPEPLLRTTQYLAVREKPRKPDGRAELDVIAPSGDQQGFQE